MLCRCRADVKPMLARHLIQKMILSLSIQQTIYMVCRKVFITELIKKLEIQILKENLGGSRRSRGKSLGGSKIFLLSILLSHVIFLLLYHFLTLVDLFKIKSQSDHSQFLYEFFRVHVDYKLL